MDKPRVNLPSLACSRKTTTCIDTNNVSRNPNISSHFQPSRIAVNNGNQLFQYSYPCQPFDQTTSTFKFSSLRSDNVEISSGDKPLWCGPTSEPKPKPSISASERMALWNRISPEEQDALVCGECTIYQLKEKYDALDKVSSNIEDLDILSPSNDQALDLTVGQTIDDVQQELDVIIEQDIVDDVQQELNDVIEQDLITSINEMSENETSENVTPSQFDDDVSYDIDDRLECEFESAISNSMVCGRPLGSGQPVTHRGLRDIIHYRSSSDYHYTTEEWIAIDVLYNFKKRRRK